MHVSSVANLKDVPITGDKVNAAVEFRSNRNRPQANLLHIPPSMNGHASMRAYSVHICKILGVQDVLYGTNRAEDNYDSWSLCTVLKQLTLANPEYDVVSERKVVRRRKLLHHCTLFNCMRPKNALPIQDLSAYGARQDLWARRHGGWTPGNAKELLKALHTMVEEAGISLDSILKEMGIDNQAQKAAVVVSTPNKTALTAEKDVVESIASLSIHITPIRTSSPRAAAFDRKEEEDTFRLKILSV